MLPEDIWLERSTYQHNGKLIVVCGFDGSGKTTQVLNLEKHYRQLKQDVLVERQPTYNYRSDSRVQQFLRNGGTQEDAKILALLAAADRHDHVKNVIKPALSQGKTIICDRYVYASLALFKHRGLSTDFLYNINSGIPKPDLAFFLYVPACELLERIKERDGTKIQFEETKIEYVTSICRNYKRMTNELIMINGTQSVDIVYESIIEHLLDEKSR